MSCDDKHKKLSGLRIGIQRYRVGLGLLLIGLVVPATLVWPRRSHAQPSQLRFQRLNVEQGLPQSRVTAITQDSRGFRRQHRSLRCFAGFVLVSALMFFCAADSWALDPHKALTQYVHDVWTTRDGLPQDAIIAIVQDSVGYIWFGTQEGLVRFDGVGFTVFDSRNTDALRGNFIHGLFADSRGNLWIGASGGLLRYREGRFDFFGKENGLWSNNEVKNISEDAAGNLWLGYSAGNEKTTNSGLGRFKDEQGRIFTVTDGLSANQVKATFPDRNGNLWIATTNGLNLLQDGRFSHYTTADGLADTFVRTVYGDRAGNLWVGTANGLNCFKDGKFTLFTTRHGLSNNSIRAILEDRDGVLWVGTDSGLNRMIAGKIEYVKGTEGLGNDEIISLLEDKEGSLWFGTHTNGLHRLRDGKFTVFGPPEGLLGASVGAIFEAQDGRILIGTNPGGLSVLREGRFETYSIDHDFHSLSNKVRMIAQAQAGFFWIGTRDGLNRLQGRRYEANMFGAALTNVTIHSFYEARDQTLWLGTDAGLKHVVGGKFVPIAHFDAFRTKSVPAICEDRSGRIWIGMNHDTGYFQGKAFTAYPGEPLRNANVQAIYEDENGVLWFATWGQGLLRLKGDRLTAYTSKDGLFDNVQWTVLDDGAGHLWMSSNRGVFCVSKQELDDFAEGRIKVFHSVVYGTEDGMRKSETNAGSPSALRSRDGRLWFSTTAGAAVIDPKNIKINHLPPPVVLEKVLVDEQMIASNVPLILPSSVKNVEFRYAGLSFIQPTRMQYKYKLEGYDTHWIDAGTRRSAFYTNLPPSNYEFKVIAANSDGVWNEQGASFKFRATAPFWQTAWFFSLGLLGIAGVATLLYRWRVSTLEREKLVQRRFAHQLIESQEAERKRIAAELHDGLGQSLLVIKNRTSIGKRMAHDGAKVLAQLDEISNATGQALEEVRGIAYNLRPYHLERLGLRESLHAMIEKIREATELDINARVALFDEVFSKDDEVLFYRVIQECLNNVIKHAQATAVEISIVQTEREVTARLQDNGRGFAATDSQSGGFGLIGLAERVRMLGGRHAIESEAGKGTTVTVIIPRKEG
jgi:signal transduction histidine kinase/ligand-binding sensor domain-containing protein